MNLPALWFGSPVWLWLLVPAAVVAFAGSMRPWTEASKGRQILGAVLRAAVLLSLVVAVADPRIERTREAAHVIFAVDRSASIPDDALARAMARVGSMRDDFDDETRVGLVLFDAEPEIAVAPGETWTPPTSLRTDSVESTDVDAALQLALGLIPGEEAGDIILVSDGRDTTREAARPQSSSRAAGRGVAIHTVPIEPSRDDPALTGLELAESAVRPGSTVEGKVYIDGTSEPLRGKVEIRLGDELIATREVELEADGSLELPFSHHLDAERDPGPVALSARLVPESDDPTPDNNEAGTTLLVGDPPSVRIITGERHDAGPLARALRAERMSVQVVSVADLEPRHEDLSEVDLVVLANAPVASIAGGKALSGPLVEELARFVDGGGGLMVLGGPQAFDMGGYGASKLARVLPVELDPVDPEVEQAATIIIILDRSGSMSAMVGGSKTKMELADEGAAASIQLLRPFDQVGVMSVTEVVRWEVPTQPVVDPEALERKVLRIRADGGGIFVYTSLVAAEEAMKHVETPMRHVILFSDAADSEEKVKGIPFGLGPGPTAQEVAERMRSRGITTSVIGIGNPDDIDASFLEELASAGGGRFYLTNDATKLRSLFVAETERLVDSSLQEVEFRPRAEKRHPIVEGIEYGSGPSLRGYQQLDARPTAEVVLSGPNGDPVLTTWRYGLGQVVAWSSDAGPRWSERWLSWPGFARQWTQAARFALRSEQSGRTAVEVDFQGNEAQLRVARRDDRGLTVDEGGLRARLKSAEGTRNLPLSALEPGLWEAQAPTVPGQSYTVEILGADDEVLAEQTFAPPPSAERRHRSADEAMLRRLAETTEGTFAPERVQPRRAASMVTDVRRLWPWFSLLALLLLPLDAWIRRPSRVM